MEKVLDEPSQTFREKILCYLGDLMKDATDFSWDSAKVAHPVLLFKLERRVLTGADISRIEQIWRAHAQKHSITKVG